MNLLSNDQSDAGESGRHVIELEPYGYKWYRVGGLDPAMTPARSA